MIENALCVAGGFILGMFTLGMFVFNHVERDPETDDDD